MAVLEDVTVLAHGDVKTHVVVPVKAAAGAVVVVAP